MSSVVFRFFVCVFNHSIIHLLDDALRHKGFIIERRGLFNDAFNTFSFQLYGVGHMIKDHSRYQRGNSATTWATVTD